VFQIPVVLLFVGSVQQGVISLMFSLQGAFSQGCFFPRLICLFSLCIEIVVFFLISRIATNPPDKIRAR